MKRALNVGLLGCGTVGSGVAERLLQAHDRDVAAFSLRGVLVRDVRKTRRPQAVMAHVTTDAMDVIRDSRTDVIVECMGGLEPAYDLVKEAIACGKHVVSANKALIATHGPELIAFAGDRGVQLLFDAAVGGAIPALSVLRSALAGEEILEISGILNGTTNYILVAMEAGCDFGAALESARAHGYAESDPANDLNGTDTAQKLSLLAHAAFERWLPWQSIARTGIEAIDRRQVRDARAGGGALRLVATLKGNRTRLDAAVEPVVVPLADPMAAATGAQNVVRVIGRGCGTLTLIGPGAGREQTASAIVGDLVAVSRL